MCLDTCGTIDVTGPISMACDGTNGLIYLFRGDTINFGASAFAVIPFVGGVGKITIKEGKKVLTESAQKEVKELASDLKNKAIKEESFVIKTATWTSEQELTLNKIVEHSYQKHIIEQKEFGALFKSDTDWKEYLKSVIQNPSDYFKSDVKTLYWDERLGRYNN